MNMTESILTQPKHPAGGDGLTIWTLAQRRFASI